MMRCRDPIIFSGALSALDVEQLRMGRKKGIDMFWFGFAAGVVATFSFLLAEHLMGHAAEFIGRLWRSTRSQGAGVLVGTESTSTITPDGASEPLKV